MATRKPFAVRWVRALGLDEAGDRLIFEQFRLVAQQIPVLYGVIIVNCLFMAALASSQVRADVALAFPAGALPIMLYRVYAWRKNARRLVDLHDYAGMRKALRGTAIMANVLAAVLAVWSVTVMLNVNPDKVAFVPLFTILSLITCAHCLSAYPIAAYSVILSGSSYIAMSMAWTGDPFLIAMALNIGLVRRQNIWRSSRRRLAECGPRLGLDFRRRACGVASAYVRWSVA